MQKKRPWNNGRFFCVFICTCQKIFVPLQPQRFLNYERVEMSEMRKCFYGGRE